MKSKSKRLFPFLVVFLAMPLMCMAQDDAKQKVNSIKKSSEYIWGEASGDDDEACYEIAHDKFITKLKAYIAQDPELSKAEGVILPGIQKKEKKLTFNRTMEVKVMCIFIKKSDILPLYQQDGADDEVAVLSPEPAKHTAEKSEAADTKDAPQFQLGTKEQAILEQPKEVEEDESKEDVVPEHSETPASQTTEIKVEEQSAPAIVSLNVLDAKAKAILTELVAQASYDKNKSWLDNRKAAEHDVMFKLSKTFTNSSGYWIIYDGRKRIVALLDTDRQTNLLTGLKEPNGKYTDSPKLWLQIYE